MTTRRRRGVRERRPPLGPPKKGRAIRCERAVLPRKNVAARSPDTLLPFGLIAEACSAEIAGHPDTLRPCCIALPRAGGERSNLSGCNFFVRPYGRTERPRGAGLIGKSLFQAVKLQTVRQGG